MFFINHVLKFGAWGGVVVNPLAPEFYI